MEAGFGTPKGTLTVENARNAQANRPFQARTLPASHDNLVSNPQEHPQSTVDALCRTYDVRMPHTLAALARSTHPGPAVAVTAVAVVLAIGAGHEAWRIVLLGIAVLANQASVGLSNDWIDADRDRAVGRTDKPVALGLVSIQAARNTSVACAVLAVVLTIPLGWAATFVHALFIGSAWAYNLGAKNSMLSVVPYLVSFGSLPLVVTLASAEPRLAAPWALGAGALLGVSAHFANVLPDLDDDRETGVRGLPHRLGRRASGIIIAISLGAASALVTFGPNVIGAVQLVGFALTVAIATTTAALAITRPPTRLLFQLIIAGALINVTLLALAGDRLYA